MATEIATEAAIQAVTLQPATPSWLPFVSLAAIFLGPLMGIWVTRLIDKAKENRKQRWDLFVTLQRTRGLELTPEHVSAINMVPIVFPKDSAVLRAWEELLDSLNDPGWNSAETDVRRRVNELSAAKRMNLFRKIATAVDAKLPDKEEHTQGYVPVAWTNEQLQTMEAREQLLKVLKGNQFIHMLAGVYQLPPKQSNSDGNPEPNQS